MSDRTRMTALALLALAATGACSGDDDGGAAGSGSQCTPGMFGNACGGAGNNGDSGSGASGQSGAAAASGSSAGGSGAASSGGMCPSVNVTASRIVPTVHLVVDGSCSMELDLSSQEPYGSCDIDEPGPDTRWGALRRALVDPSTGVVTQLEDLIRFGFYLFGTRPRCPLVDDPLAPAQGQGDAIRAAFPIAPPGANTPTGLALQRVVEMSASTTDPDARNAPEIILLATDGAPNACNDSTIDFEPSIEAAMAARDRGISMYVLSLAEPTGEYATHLQEMADIGIDQPNAPVYSPSSPEELQRDLEELIGGAVGCDVRVNGTVDTARACEGRVLLNGEPLACGSDWELAEPSLIRLNGDACDRFKNNADASVTADWPCGVFEGVD